MKTIYGKIITIVFLAAVFYIGSATFPSTVSIIGSFLNGGQAGILSAKDLIDREYRSMLDFSGYYLTDKGAYINLNGLMARAMGQRYMNKRVKLDNNHLTYLNEETDITRSAIQMTKLYNSQKAKGKDFLLVLAPFQISKYEDMLPAGYTDYSNQNADNLLDALVENDVPTLDLRDVMHDEGIGHTEAFFVTDHHWTTETGFWGYCETIDFLVKSGVIDPIDSMYTDISEYNIEVYKDFFLGSSGKRTGSYYAGVDDFAVITPKYDTNISVSIPDVSINKKGRFADVSFNDAEIRLDYFSANPYGAYGHGSYGMKHYRNEAAPLELKVLAIGDSFSRVPFAFLPLVFSVCDQLDMRYYHEDFASYYSEFNPDLLIVLTNPSQIAGKNYTFNYFNEIQVSDIEDDLPDDQQG